MFFLRYCNLLSCDAVIVALLWQEVFARAAHIMLRWPERLVLGGAVWIIYVLDHLLDSSATPNTSAPYLHLSNSAPRHYFVKKHQSILLPILLVTALVCFLISLTFPLSFVIAGITLGLMTFFYLCINFFYLRQGRWLEGREVIIALIFTFGCALFPLLKTGHLRSLFFSFIALTLLGILNTLLIARMERQASLLLLWPDLLPPPSWLLSGSLLFLIGSKIWGDVTPAKIAFAISLAGLSLIPTIAKKTNYETASLATDGALALGATLALLC